MTVNENFGEYELVTDDSNGTKLKVRHLPTGKEQVFDKGAFSTEEAHFSGGQPWYDVTQSPYNAAADGTGDQKGAIQAAIDDAEAAGGGIVYFPHGTYRITGTFSDGDLIHVDQPYVTLLGQSWKSEIKLADNTTDTDQGARMITTATAATEFTIRNLTINGNQQNQSTPSAADDGHNLHVTGKNSTVYNIQSINSTGDGVETGRAENTRIYGNLFRDSWEQNIHLNGGRHITITGNILRGEVNNGNLMTWNARTVEHISIVGNIIESSDDKGVYLSSGPGEVRDVLVASNIIRDNGTGVHFEDRSDSTAGPKRLFILNNLIYNNDTQGIDQYTPNLGAEQIYVSGNYIARNDRSGVRLRHKFDDYYVEDNWIIDNNQSNGFGAGIRVDDEQNYDADGVHINDNHVDSTGTPKHNIGIVVEDATAATYSNLHVDRNYVKNTQGGLADVRKSALTEYRNGPGPFRDNGTATISSGTTSVTVNYDLSPDPPLNSATDTAAVTPTSSLGAASEWWVSDPSGGDGKFDINVDADPTQDVTFSWRMDQTRGHTP